MGQVWRIYSICGQILNTTSRIMGSVMLATRGQSFLCSKITRQYPCPEKDLFSSNVSFKHVNCSVLYCELTVSSSIIFWRNNFQQFKEKILWISDKNSFSNRFYLCWDIESCPGSSHSFLINSHINIVQNLLFLCWENEKYL